MRPGQCWKSHPQCWLEKKTFRSLRRKPEIISARKRHNSFGTLSIFKYPANNNRHNENKPDDDKIGLDPGIPHNPREVASRHRKMRYIPVWWSACSCLNLLGVTHRRGKRTNEQNLDARAFDLTKADTNKTSFATNNGTVWYFR